LRRPFSSPGAAKRRLIDDRVEWSVVTEKLESHNARRVTAEIENSRGVNRVRLAEKSETQLEKLDVKIVGERYERALSLC
jgi:hypothetical protein